MKILYLLRHAKSSWADSGLSDRQRPLNARGQHDAPMMGERFAARGEVASRVISSPAVRAMTTARMFSEACGYDVSTIDSAENLYFLGSGSIEEVITSQDDSVDALMLVFHNPDITYFANSIGDNLRIDNVPTAGLLRLECDVERWQDWSRASTRFDYFDYPRNLSGELLRG